MPEELTGISLLSAIVLLVVREIIGKKSTKVSADATCQNTERMVMELRDLAKQLAAEHREHERLLDRISNKLNGGR